MSWVNDFLKELQEKLTPTEFEEFLGILLENMGFENIEVTGRSGDRGIDLKATWTQSEVPGLEIDLNFIIQAKMFNPRRTLNPRFIRELRDSLQSGDWGLLITTSRVSGNTRNEGISDQSRIVSIIDGRQLANLCARYDVGVTKAYKFNNMFKEKEKPVTEPVSSYPRDLSMLISSALNEEFSKLGRKPIYKSKSKMVLARWSQKYEREDSYYWYGLSARDVEDIDNFDLTHFAYIGAYDCVFLLPLQVIKDKIRNSELNATYKDEDLRHFHIHIIVKDGKYWWNLKSGEKEDLTSYYYQIKKG